MKIIYFFIVKVSAILYRLHASVYKLRKKLEEKQWPLSRINKEKWYADRGDYTLRMEYPLMENSVVFDVGGYKGDWAAEIYSRYRPRVFLFEPVSSNFNYIVHRFSKNPGIKCFQQGLGSYSREVFFQVQEESSTLSLNNRVAEKNSGSEKVQLLGFNEFVQKHGIERIDLIKINIEGGEYELLETIIKTDFISKINNIQVQFHDFVPNAAERMKAIQLHLSRTHSLTYQYLFVWENWKLKE